MFEDDIFQNGNVIYQYCVSGMPAKNRAACIDDVCMWNAAVYSEFTSIAIIIDSEVITWLMSLSFLRKSLVSMMELGILCDLKCVVFVGNLY